MGRAQLLTTAVALQKKCGYFKVDVPIFVAFNFIREVFVMSKDNAALNLDKDFNPLSAGSHSPTETYFKAIIKPALHSGTDMIVAEKLIYASLIEDSISLLGSTGTGADFKQLAVILPIGIKDGRHDLVMNSSKPYAVIFQGGQASGSTSGHVEFKRETNKDISGNAEFKIQYNGRVYDVSAKFSLTPTGDVP